MKVDQKGEAMGRPSYKSSFSGHPSARFLAPTAKTFYFLLFLPSGAGLQRPAAVKGARLSGAASANP